MNINAIYEQLLNLPEVKINGSTIGKRVISFSCTLSQADDVCPSCGQICTIINDTKTRKLRDLNISNREVFLLVDVHQFYCRSCNKYHTETLNFADSHKSYTHRQSKYIFELCLKQSYTEVGAVVNMHSKTVERLVLHAADLQIKSLHDAQWQKVRRIGIDEQSHRKGHRNYICVITDLDSGLVLDMLEDRKKETLVTYFQGLSEKIRAQITDVSCDLYAAYISAAELCFPHARISLDRFHVTKLLNEPLNRHRKELRKKDKNQIIYKKLKWILFKQYHLLNEQEFDDLNAAFELDPQLKDMYFRRDKFHQILENNDDVNAALEKITEWIQSTKTDVLNVFEEFTKMVERHKNNIANYVKDKVSNAATEGLNNLIRVVKRISYGLPNFKHLRLKTMAISNSLH